MVIVVVFDFEENKMSNIFVELCYVQSYEWVCLEVDGSVIVGIFDYVQEVFGDVVFIELLELGKIFVVGQEVGVVELVKVVFDIYLLIGGEVIVINEVLVDILEDVNNDLYVFWFFKFKLSNLVELDKLFDVVGYQVVVDVEG